MVFDVNSSEKERTSKLHRRDTPHHLKNKRIAQTTLEPADQEKEALLAAVSIALKYPLFTFTYTFC